MLVALMMFVAHPVLSVLIVYSMQTAEYDQWYVGDLLHTFAFTEPRTGFP
uniref:Uncharacterized protein n=1 Tax=Anguilla anguilla TaxID=7936 RepID=A0A0E9XBC9_ANGAN